MLASHAWIGGSIFPLEAHYITFPWPLFGIIFRVAGNCLYSDTFVPICSATEFADECWEQRLDGPLAFTYAPLFLGRLFGIIFIVSGSLLLVL
jgi:hypothetical protein